MQGSYEVPVAWIRHVAGELGPGSPVLAGALAAAGLPAAFLAGAVRTVRVKRYVDFLETAARLAEDEVFGLRLGRSYDLRASGLAAYVSITAASLREAMQTATRYGAMNDSGADYALVESGGAASFRMDSRSPLMRGSRHAAEFKAAFIVASCRRWVGADFRPLAVRFAHAREHVPDEAEAFFGCPVRFAAEATEMLVSVDQLGRRVSAGDPYLRALLAQQAEQMLAERASAGDSLGARAGRLVSEDLPKGVPTARRVASALGMSERTFARRLSDEGTSFRQLVDELRRDKARRYLSDPDLSLAQIAYLLGYADQSAFSNSFRRWTGQSPRQFRGGGTIRPALSPRSGPGGGASSRSRP